MFFDDKAAIVRPFVGFNVIPFDQTDVVHDSVLADLNMTNRQKKEHDNGAQHIKLTYPIDLLTGEREKKAEDDEAA